MAHYHKFNLCQSIFQEGQQILHLLSSEKMRIGFRATTKQLVFRNSKNIKNPKLQSSPKHIQKYLDMFKELLEHFI